MRRRLVCLSRCVGCAGYILIVHIIHIISSLLPYFFVGCRILSAYYVAFGPYGPRAPVTPPGQSLKVFLATMGLVGVAGLLFLGVTAICQSFLYGIQGRLHCR